MPPRRRFTRRYRPGNPHVRNWAAREIQYWWRRNNLRSIRNPPSMDILQIATQLDMDERWMNDVGFLVYMQQQPRARRYWFINTLNWLGRDRYYTNVTTNSRSGPRRYWRS